MLEGYGFDRSQYAVHINFPGGMPVDGPSAGTAMFLAAYSAFTGAAVPGDVALTGEISLTGKILPVGGVTEKLQAAEEASVTRAYIPKANWQGRYERLGLEAVPVEEISELLEMVFTKKEEKQAGMPQRGILTAEGLQK